MDEEFEIQRRFALDEPDSRYFTFMKRTAGFRFFRKNEVICEPRWSVYCNYRYFPKQLEQIENGEHPNYKRVPKENFDEIQSCVWGEQKNED